MSSENEELWIGSAYVEQPERNGALGDADAAYVNVIAVAVNRADFRRQTKKATEGLGLMLVRLKDAEPLRLRLSKHSLDDELSEVAEEVKHSGRLAFDVFYTFDFGT